MVNKKKNFQNDLKENIFSKKGIEDANKVQLQELYSSFLGKNIEEVKKNSKRLRYKIYIFGLTVVIMTIILTFFIEKISFVTS